MSDIPRYIVTDDGNTELDDEGYLVYYTTAVAAVAAARAEGHRDAIASMDGQSVILASECEKQIAAARAEGQRDERERCRAAVLDHFKVAPLAAEPILRRIG